MNKQDYTIFRLLKSAAEAGMDTPAPATPAEEPAASAAPEGSAYDPATDTMNLPGRTPTWTSEPGSTDTPSWLTASDGSDPYSSLTSSLSSSSASTPTESTYPSFDVGPISLDAGAAEPGSYNTGMFNTGYNPGGSLTTPPSNGQPQLYGFNQPQPAEQPQQSQPRDPYFDSWTREPPPDNTAQFNQDLAEWDNRGDVGYMSQDEYDRECERLASIRFSMSEDDYWKYKPELDARQEDLDRARWGDPNRQGQPVRQDPSAMLEDYDNTSPFRQHRDQWLGARATSGVENAISGGPADVPSGPAGGPRGPGEQVEYGSLLPEDGYTEVREWSGMVPPTETQTYPYTPTTQEVTNDFARDFGRDIPYPDATRGDGTPYTPSDPSGLPPLPGSSEDAGTPYAPSDTSEFIPLPPLPGSNEDDGSFYGNPAYSGGGEQPQPADGGEQEQPQQQLTPGSPEYENEIASIQDRIAELEDPNYEVDDTLGVANGRKERDQELSMLRRQLASMQQNGMTPDGNGGYTSSGTVSQADSDAAASRSLQPPEQAPEAADGSDNEWVYDGVDYSDPVAVKNKMDELEQQYKDGTISEDEYFDQHTKVWQAHNAATYGTLYGDQYSGPEYEQDAQGHIIQRVSNGDGTTTLRNVEDPAWYGLKTVNGKEYFDGKPVTKREKAMLKSKLTFLGSGEDRVRRKRERDAQTAYAQQHGTRNSDGSYTIENGGIPELQGVDLLGELED